MKARVLISLLVAGALTGAWGQADPDLPVISVLDFAAEGISAVEARVITDVLSTYIVRIGAYRVIDRNQREAILSEIAFSYSDCTDEGCQLQIGRLLSASQLVVGSIGRIEGWLVATVRLVDVPTGEIVGSVSRKYASLEGVIDGLADLAVEVVEAGGRQVQALEQLSAQALVTSAKRAELEARLERLRRQTDPELYARWLRENGFAEYEAVAPIEEKTEFLEEFRAQSNTRGNAVETSLSFIPFKGRGTGEGGEYTIASGTLLGWTLSWSYQFNNRVSAGAFWHLAWHREEGREYDALSMFLGEYEEDRIDFCLGGQFIVGDKTESLALLLASGFGIGVGELIPLRGGVYFRNIYVGYMGLYSAFFDQMFHGLEAGYSLFLGQRRTWPPESIWGRSAGRRRRER